MSRDDQRSILLVDDDRDLAQMLCTALAAEGYQTSVANNGRDGLRSFYNLKPDLVILDIMMPTMDGWTVCERIREMSETPIMVLTARTSSDEISRGLYLGADDYITKPFGVAEFLARVRAVLRRSRSVAKAPAQSFLTIDGRLSVDLTKRRVIVAGKPTAVLSPTELKLLSALVTHAGEIVPFEVLVERVWGADRSKSGSHLKTYVHYLRNKIEEDPAHPRYIITERGLGYRFMSLL